MPKHRGPIAPLPSPGVSFPLTTLRELEGSLLPLRRGEGTRRGPGPAAGPRTATPPAAAQRVARHGGERLQDRAGRFSGGRGMGNLSWRGEGAEALCVRTKTKPP